MLNKSLVHTCFALTTIILSLPALAHEYWLQPNDFFVQHDELIQAHIKTGQDFRGNNFAYLPKSISSMHLHLGDSSTRIYSRFGDYPAISVPAAGNGLNILSVTTPPTSLTYEEPGKFASFVDNEGLDGVLVEHEKRKLPEIGFIEVYKRYTKSLIKAGDGEGADRKVGLEFEWVLHTNPYTTKQKKLVAQLWWQDKAHANKQFRYFIQTGKTLSTDIARTDSNGMATLPFIPGSTYLVNAVHMLIPTKETVIKYNAVWDSRWASLTFATE